MSIVSLQFGQCGNQIGQSLYKLLAEDVRLKSSNSDSTYINDSINRWFHVNQRGLWEPRSVLIDTECKVVSENFTSPFKFKNVVAKAFGGSANNWAFGYTARSEFLIGEVMECVRREAERCDYISSFLNIFSSSGGTGSGVGSKIVEIIRDEFQNKNIVNAIVLPYKTGEIVTQNYNTVLTLSKIYNPTDLILLFENDRIHYMCNKLLALKHVQFSDMNLIISQQLASILQPVSKLSLPQLISDLAAHPSYKIVYARSAPHILKEHMVYEKLPTWPMLVSNVIKSNRFDYQTNSARCLKKLKSVGSVLISWGETAPNAMEIKPLLNQNNYVPWVPLQSHINHYHENREFINTKKFITHLNNSNNIFHSLDNITEDAWNLFTYGAYVHHYKKFGIEEESFLHAFETLESILYDYNNL